MYMYNWQTARKKKTVRDLLVLPDNFDVIRMRKYSETLNQYQIVVTKLAQAQTDLGTP